MNEEINKIIKRMEENGSAFENPNQLASSMSDIVSKARTFDDVMNRAISDIKEATKHFLDGKNDNDNSYISGFSTCIYLPTFDNSGDYKFTIIGGASDWKHEIPVNEHTKFDVASITKMFTLLLLFKLEEQGIISLDEKVSNLNPDIQALEDFTINDLIRLHGELRTQGNVATAQSVEEAFQILKTVYLTSNDRSRNLYTDFGSIVIGNTLEHILSKRLGYKMTFDSIMHKYLLDPLQLENTEFNPTFNITGNGGGDFVHDPKARALGGAVGSAGLFTTSEDLAILSRNIFSVNYVNTSFFRKKDIEKLGEITFPLAPQSNKGNLGLYVKHPLGLQKSFTPNELATGSFSHQGWTGSVAVFDPKQSIHQSFLVNAIYPKDSGIELRNDKAVGFGAAFEEYQRKITETTITLYIAREYYKRYGNQIDVNKTIILK